MTIETPQERINQILQINDEYKFDALKVELNARLISKKNLPINHNFSSFTIKELADAVEFVEANEITATTPRLFVDMDGTLAVFQKLDTLEALYEQGYFLSLQPIENVLNAVKDVIANNPEIDVYILSAVLSDSKFAIEEKNAWLDRYLPELPKENRIFSICGQDKKEFIPNGVDENDYLLDDYTKNLTLWSPPGQGIKLLNGINNTKGTWQGQKLSYDVPSDLLAKQIACVVLDDKTIEKNAGYYILDKTKDYALAYHPTAPSTYVIWDCDIKGGYCNGRYSSSLKSLNISEFGFGKTIEATNSNLKNFDEYKQFKSITLSTNKNVATISPMKASTPSQDKKEANPFFKSEGISYD